MTDWEISEDRQHILVRDGASNMALELQLADISSVHCFLHILDLVIKDSILSQRAIIDLCAKVRQIATHFNHSSLARKNIKNRQAEQGIQLPLFPVQDVSTRWNSTYLMLEGVGAKCLANMAVCSFTRSVVFVLILTLILYFKPVNDLEVIPVFDDCFKCCQRSYPSRNTTGFYVNITKL